MKGNLLLLAILFTGLSAGLFYAWQVSVIPGTKKITDFSYLESMQQINREILNPWFFVIFFGPVLLMIISAIKLYSSSDLEAFILVILALISYVIGTVGITSFGNVPLNDMLDSKMLTGISLPELKGIREAYEGKWNRLHLIRTVFSIISFALLIWASKAFFISESASL